MSTGLQVAGTGYQGVSASSGKSMNALVPASITDALNLSDIMAKASLMPEHLRGKPGDCLLVVMQAQRWGMDAFSVAQCTSVVSGKLCYEGKLVSAMLYSMGVLDSRLRYAYSGSGDSRKVVVTGRLRGETEDRTIEGTVKDWATNNQHWKRSPDDMLAYRGARQWARRHAPEALLGVYTPDEITEDEPREPRTVSATPISRDAGPPPAYPDEDFKANLPKWHAVMESGKKTPDEIIAMVSTKGALSDEQQAAIRDCAPVATGEAA